MKLELSGEAVLVIEKYMVDNGLRTYQEGAHAVIMSTVVEEDIKRVVKNVPKKTKAQK